MYSCPDTDIDPKPLHLSHYPFFFVKVHCKIFFIIAICFLKWKSLFNFVYSTTSSLPSDVDLINILPGFPVVNSPLELRFYVRLKAGVNQHVTIDREVLYAIFENFAQNISEVLGVEFTGTQILDPDYIFRHSWLLY